MGITEYEYALQEADKLSPDNERVLFLLDMGVKAGDERAIFARATCYEDGKFGSVVDKSKANDLFFKLKDSNIPEALFAIAYCYDVGDGVESNKNTAFAYYVKSAVLGHNEANHQVSEFYREGKNIDRNLILHKFFRERSMLEENVISPNNRRKLR